MNRAPSDWYADEDLWIETYTHMFPESRVAAAVEVWERAGYMGPTGAAAWRERIALWHQYRRIWSRRRGSWWAGGG